MKAFIFSVVLLSAGAAKANSLLCSDWSYSNSYTTVAAGCMVHAGTSGQAQVNVYVRTCNEYDDRGNFLQQVQQTTSKARCI